MPPGFDAAELLYRRGSLRAGQMIQNVPADHAVKCPVGVSGQEDTGGFQLCRQRRFLQQGLRDIHGAR